MDCLKKKGRTKAADCVFGQRFLPGELPGTRRCFPSEQAISWEEEESKQPRPAHLPVGKKTNTQLYNLIPLPASASPRICCAPGSWPCERPAAPRSIKSAGGSSQGQLELLGGCWVPSAADGGSGRRRQLCRLEEEEAGAMSQGAEVLLCKCCLFWRGARPEVMERWLPWYPADAQGLGAAGPLGAAHGPGSGEPKSFHNVVRLRIRC